MTITRKQMPISQRAEDESRGSQKDRSTENPKTTDGSKLPYEPPEVKEVGDLDDVRGAVIGPTLVV